ncbi:MAG TPA: hypothetical protein VH092_05055 [Urbifossiella sp.]|nr:hypothetical protein [Urbifossiella sp.]
MGVGGIHGVFDHLHANGLTDFVNPEGWGYVRSRREVAGFLPHAFSRVLGAFSYRLRPVGP